MSHEEEYFQGDLIPMIDLVFVVLMFVLVCSTFKQSSSSISLTLPAVSNRNSVVKNQQVHSVYLTEYEFLWDGKNTDISEIKSEISEAQILPVEFYSDEYTSWKRIALVLSELKTRGISEIRFQTRFGLFSESIDSSGRDNSE
jgi:biopolymer transport protein ExbD